MSPIWVGCSFFHFGKPRPLENHWGHQLGRLYLHLAKAGEVAGGDLMLPLDLRVDLSQVVHQLFLFALFTEDVGHLLLEGADDVGVDLWRPEGQTSGASWTPCQEGSPRKLGL